MAKLWLDGSRMEGKTDSPPAILADLELAINLCTSAIPLHPTTSDRGFVPLALLQPLQVQSAAVLPSNKAQSSELFIHHHMIKSAAPRTVSPPSSSISLPLLSLL